MEEVHPASWTAVRVARPEQRLGESFPGCPAEECRAIADHACQKYSGRVGRSAAASQFDPDCVDAFLEALAREQNGIDIVGVPAGSGPLVDELHRLRQR